MGSKTMLSLVFSWIENITTKIKRLTRKHLQCVSDCESRVSHRFSRTMNDPHPTRKNMLCEKLQTIVSKFANSNATALKD